MNGYVEAGYTAALGALALYAGRLVLRRRSLERHGAPKDAPSALGERGQGRAKPFGSPGGRSSP